MNKNCEKKKIYKIAKPIPKGRSKYSVVESTKSGIYGGHRGSKVYGLMDCSRALTWISPAHRCRVLILTLAVAVFINADWDLIRIRSFTANKTPDLHVHQVGRTVSGGGRFVRTGMALAVPHIVRPIFV